MESRFLELLQQRPVVCDGAMGTQLHVRGFAFGTCFEHLNLTHPQVVQEVHKAYILAGADVIQTNTYAGSRLHLEAFGLGDQVREINRRAARLAREVREFCGTQTLVAGSVGPLGPLVGTPGGLAAARAQALFTEQMAALIEGGCDLLVLETFGDLAEAVLALQAARALTSLPVVVQLTFGEDGRTVAGQLPGDVARTLADLGATVVGANCSVGPSKMAEIVAAMAGALPAGGPFLSAQPNAGWPQRHGGRIFYPTQPAYFAEHAARMVGEQGVRLVGGCCGTTPDHIAAIAARVQALAGTAAPPPAPAVEVRPPAPAAGEREQPKGAGQQMTLFQRKLAAGEFVVSMEMHPPRTHLTGAFLRAARAYKEAGVSIVNVVDSPMARVKMAATLACVLLQERTGLETILHLTPRDRSLVSLQADLLGAHALRVRNVLVIKGDPHVVGRLPGTVNIYDVDSIGLIHVIHQFTRGRDLLGNDIGTPAAFFVGGALNPNAPDLELEIERFHRKVEAGMQFAMVQPVFDLDVLEQLVVRLGRPPIPILPGICPVHSYQHALLLHNEIPGITLTEAALERMRRAGANGEQEGIAMARELLVAARQAGFAGAYIMPSYGRHEHGLAVLEALSGTGQAAR